MWAYPLKQKDHAASTIKEDWLPFVEKQAECVVKRIRTDRGAERANRTILETARALLIESGVGNSMWPHAVRHATVARNRVLTKVGNESWVPLERWLGRKPPVDMLRVFGCIAVAHVPKKYRSKLGASAIWCVHLGLAAESKGWLLWEPSKGVLFDSRDVKFVEGMMYGGWKKQPETKVSQQMEQITMQLDLTPSVWEEGEEAAAEGGDGEKVQEAPGGGGDDVETSDSTKEAAGSEGGEQQLGKAKVLALPSRRKPKGVVMRGWETPVSRPGRTRMATMKLTAGADVAEQQLGNEEALLILPHGYDPDEEDEPAYCFLAPAPEEPASMEEALAGPDREKWLVSRDAEYCWFAHVPKKYRSKLGASAIWCVHLGLAAESKGWLLWEPSKGVLFDSRDAKFVEGMMYGGWKKQPETKVSQQMEQITMQLDVTPSAWEEGEEAAAEAGADVAKQQLGNEEALLILPHGYDPDEEDEPAYCFLAPTSEEPSSMEEALAGPDREKIKTDDKGQVTIYKSRLVAKGFMQKEKQDFNEIFAPTAKPPTLRVLLANAAVSGKSIIQMDISTAFLNGILEEDVYMTQPPVYEDGTGRVCKLKKSIYSLKLALRCWYQKLAAVLEEMGFRTSSCDESLFLKGEGEKLVLFLVYVDDILLFSSSMKEIQKVQQQLMKNFKCKTLGEVNYYLGMHVERDLDHRWLKLHQEKFVKELREKYGIENERKVATPLPAEFKLVKAAEDEGVEAEEQQQFQSLVHTRPDISFSVGQLARVVQNPSKEQVDAAERVVKYLNSHPSIGVQYSASA
ncbi:unnamed protein product [Closterium sp. NIES-53]